VSPEYGSQAADNLPYFFLSYARTPRRDPRDPSDPDRWVYKLYRDLCETILTMTKADPQHVGFMDRVNRPGVRWPDELARALATCRVFIPLYSDRYFASENCGKEWFAFARRELNHRARIRGTRSAIIPVMWIRLKPEQLPDVAHPLHYDHPDLGSRYNTEGLYGMIKLQRYRSDYQLAVHRLADRIVQVANETQIAPEHPADYPSLESAFGPVKDPGAGRDTMQITVLAPDINSRPEGRSGTFYGPTPETWAPYQTDYTQPLAEYAAELAKCFGCQPVVGTFAHHAAGWAAGGRRVSPSLCLVDAWAALSPACAAQLRRLDQLEHSWVSVLLPWNSQDAELTAAEAELRERLRELLGRKLDSVPYRCRLAAIGIPTLREFGEIMPKMAMIMLKRFRKEAPVYGPRGTPAPRPRLREVDLVDQDKSGETFDE
jgi:FxsC-like protein